MAAVPTRTSSRLQMLTLGRDGLRRRRQRREEKFLATTRAGARARARGEIAGAQSGAVDDKSVVFAGDAAQKLKAQHETDHADA